MKNYTFDDFRAIIAQLRGENGCPWDREQTHESLRPCMTEEAAELVAAVRIYQKTGNDENMREELGDVLLQVLMHSQIAEEEGRFSVDDVIQVVSEKMIRRHPHIFGDQHADSSRQVLKKWEEIKKEEKAGQFWTEDKLQDIPVELPALVRGQKVLKKAKKKYNYEITEEKSLEQIKAAVDTIEKSDDMETQEKEKIITDLLLSAVNLARLYKVQAEQLVGDRILDIIDELEP